MSRHGRIAEDGGRCPARLWVAGSLLGATVLTAGCGIPPPHEQSTFPQTHWSSVSPEAAGFDVGRLETFSRRLGGVGCIIDRGRMAYAWGDTTKPYDIASAAKPFYTHFTLNAIEEGLIESLDDPVVNWAPELAALNADLEFKDRTITFRHLLDQTSGYGLREPPGAAFGYNDYQTGLLVWLLFRRVYACGYGGADAILLHDRLGIHLKFQDQPTFQDPGSWPGRLRISARDWARFGHLYLMNGQWRGQSVLRKEWVQLALNSPLPVSLPRTQGQPAERLHAAHSIGGGPDQKGHAGSHSFFWWLNRQTADGERLLPDATPRTFAAVGHGGRFILIGIPEYQSVIVWLDAFASETLSPFDTIGRLRVNGAIRELMDARTGRP